MVETCNSEQTETQIDAAAGGNSDAQDWRVELVLVYCVVHVLLDIVGLWRYCLSVCCTERCTTPIDIEVSAPTAGSVVDVIEQVATQTTQIPHLP